VTEAPVAHRIVQRTRSNRRLGFGSSYNWYPPGCAALDVNQGAVADRDANPVGNIADPNFGIAVKNDETRGAALDAGPGDVT
jgi:hypothetical protein